MAMSEADKLAFRQLIADPTHGPVIQASIDARVTAALETYKTKNPSAADAQARLDQIVNAYEGKLSQAKLENVLIRESYRRGLDPDIFQKLGVQFSDEKDIQTKLDAYQFQQSELEKKLRHDIISAGSYQPGGGDGHRSVKLDDLTPAEILVMEQGGRLDPLLR